MKTKALFFALVAALALVCTAVSCQKQGANGIYGVTQQSSGDYHDELLGDIAHEMHLAVQKAVGNVSTRSSSNDSKALSAAQGVIDSKSTKPAQGSGAIILYFAPSTPLGQPDAEKVILKRWDF